MAGAVLHILVGAVVWSSPVSAVWTQSAPPAVRTPASFLSESYKKGGIAGAILAYDHTAAASGKADPAGLGQLAQWTVAELSASADDQVRNAACAATVAYSRDKACIAALQAVMGDFNNTFAVRLLAVNALRILGGPLFARWTDNLLGYLPQAIGGVVIIVLSLIGGSLSRHILEQASDSLGVGQSSLLGRLAQGVIVITGVVIGIDQFGVNIEFLIQIATVTAGAVFGGIALVFALGTRQHLANLIGAHYVRKHYAPGDHIKVGAFEGRIVEISDGCVFLETAQGDVSVPAQNFSQEPFVKLRSHG